MIGIQNVSILIAYLDGEWSLVFREQGAFAGCRAETPHHGDPLREPEVNSNARSRLMKYGVPCPSGPMAGSGPPLCLWPACLMSPGEWGGLREAGNVPAVSFHPEPEFHAEIVLPRYDHPTVVPYRRTYCFFGLGQGRILT